MPRPRLARSGTGRALPSFTLSVIAGEGGGKTNFALSMPKPLTIVSVDPNTRAVVEKAVAEGVVDEGDVTVHYLKMPATAFNDKDDIKDDAAESWEAVIDALRPLVGDNPDGVKSVGLDTATEFDVMNVLSTFGKSDQISPETRRNMMGPVNTRWKGVIRALGDAGLNVCLLHRSRAKWETKLERGVGGSKEVRSEMSGPWDFERVGYKETGNMVSVEVQLKFDPDREGASKLSDRFGLRISRSTIRPAIIGSEWWGRQKAEDGTRIHCATFAWLAVQLYPHTTLDDWK